MDIDASLRTYYRKNLSGTEFFEVLTIFRLPNMTGLVILRGDFEEQHVATMGGPKGTSYVEMNIPYSDCLMAVVCGCFPPDGGREKEEGSFDMVVKRGFLSLVTPTHIRQVPLPSGPYIIKGRLYKQRREGSPDFIMLLERQDGIPVALLHDGTKDT